MLLHKDKSWRCCPIFKIPKLIQTAASRSLASKPRVSRGRLYTRAAKVHLPQVLVPGPHGLYHNDWSRTIWEDTWEASCRHVITHNALRQTSLMYFWNDGSPLRTCVYHDDSYCFLKGLGWRRSVVRITIPQHIASVTWITSMEDSEMYAHDHFFGSPTLRLYEPSSRFRLEGWDADSYLGVIRNQHLIILSFLSVLHSSGTTKTETHNRNVSGGFTHASWLQCNIHLHFSPKVCSRSR